MFDHVGLRVRDLARSKAFYSAVLAPLGHAIQSEGDGYAGFGPAGAPALWLHAQPAGTATQAHLAFRAASPEAVRAFHARGLGQGAADNGAPGPRPDYGPTYYAAFLIDPDGNNVEAVCL